MWAAAAPAASNTIITNTAIINARMAGALDLQISIAKKTHCKFHLGSDRVIQISNPTKIDWQRSLNSALLYMRKDR
jgi:hypothetical protein